MLLGFRGAEGDPRGEQAGDGGTERIDVVVGSYGELMQEKKSSYSDVLKAHGVTPEVWQAACEMQYLKESVFCHIFTAYEVFPDANKFELAELRERSARESWFAD